MYIVMGSWVCNIDNECTAGETSIRKDKTVLIPMRGELATRCPISGRPKNKLITVKSLHNATSN